MKRLIKAAIVAVLCITLLGGCEMVKLISENTSKESVTQTNTPAVSEDEKKAPAESEKSTVQAVNSTLPDGPLSINESYFAVLGATYEELSGAYGDERICASQEGGPFANFEAACIYCNFDASVYKEYYDSYDSWILDKNEYDYDGVLYYIGELYEPADFVVNSFKVYGEGANVFLGSDEPVMISVVNEHFGSKAEKITPDEVYGIYETSDYEYGEYILRFEVTPVGSDYIVEAVNIRGKDFEIQPSLKQPSTVKESEQAQPTQLAKDIFFEEIAGTWRFSDALLEEGENFYIEIDEDLRFRCTHAIAMGAELFTGQVRHLWNYSDSVDDFPDMLSLELDEVTDSAQRGGAFLISMAFVGGEWRLDLQKTSGGMTLLDLVEPANIHTLYREEKEKSSSAGLKKDETFTAKLWERNGQTGLLWLEHGEFYDSDGRFVSDNHNAVRYMLCPDPDMGGLYKLYEGNVYIFTTVSNGEVVTIRKAWPDIGEELDFDDIMELALEILVRKVPDYREYLSMGMKALFTGETSVIDGKTCYDISVGTDHEEHFVQEVHYSVHLDYGKVYVLDFMNGKWLLAE